MYEFMLDGSKAHTKFVLLDRDFEKGVHLAVRPMLFYVSVSDNYFVGGELRVAWNYLYGVTQGQTNVIPFRNPEVLKTAYPQVGLVPGAKGEYVTVFGGMTKLQEIVKAGAWVISKNYHKTLRNVYGLDKRWSDKDTRRIAEIMLTLFKGEVDMVIDKYADKPSEPTMDNVIPFVGRPA